LVFIEVKRTDNAEARGSGQGEPAVASQLRRYRRQLESDELRKEIKQVYAEVIRVLGQILGAELPGPPQKLLPTVPLLVVGAADAPSPRAKEVWQRDLLAQPAALDAEIIGVDGRNGRVAAALDDFFARLASESAGAARP
jgi:hypothetical protein